MWQLGRTSVELGRAVSDLCFGGAVGASRPAAAAGPGPGAREQILVLKLGALGNVVLSFGPFAAIRRHHPDATITLLTTAPYAAWMAESPWFDRVLVDSRPRWWDLRGVWRLRRMLTDRRFDRVYDLQTSSRSSHYLRLFPRSARPEWSGIAPGCSHPDLAPDRASVHDIERQYAQLRQAGVMEAPPPALDWCHGDIGRFALPARFVLLVPGSSPHRPVKRWPVAGYRALAAWLESQGLTPVMIGAEAERALGAAIAAGTGARDLTGRTSFGDIADLGRRAVYAVGNDTGPMHLLAAVGCPSLVLFSADSDPARCVPRAPAGGGTIQVLRRPDLAGLDASTVIAAVAGAV